MAARGMRTNRYSINKSIEQAIRELQWTGGHSRKIHAQKRAIELPVMEILNGER